MTKHDIPILIAMAAAILSPAAASAQSLSLTPPRQATAIVFGERLTKIQAAEIEGAIPAQDVTATPVEPARAGPSGGRKVRVVYPLPANP